jgi:hypothetical protein
MLHSYGLFTILTILHMSDSFIEITCATHTIHIVIPGETSRFLQLSLKLNIKIVKTEG